MTKYFLPLIFFALCALSFSDCGISDFECDPDDDQRLDEIILNAIPHTDGQRVVYDVSDGSSMTITYNGGFQPAVDEFGCSELFIMDFRGSNGARTITGEVNANPAFGGFNVVFYFNTSRRNDLSVSLLGTGEITAGRDPMARVHAEFTINGTTYQDVLVEDYENTVADRISRVYYNIDFGLLGVEFVDGLTVLRR